jgi:DNA-binding transcriptional ArsR family regulator
MPAALAALGDPTRQAIVDRLAGGQLSVQQIADSLPVSRPAVSQHLKVLTSAGLVSGRAVGARRVYRLEPAAVAALRDQLDTYWRRALSAFEQVVDDDSPRIPQEEP